MFTVKERQEMITLIEMEIDGIALEWDNISDYNLEKLWYYVFTCVEIKSNLT